MDFKFFRSSTALTCLVALTVAGSAAQADQGEMPAETIFSKSLRFQGEVVEVLPSGQAIRERAIFRGRAFDWAGKIEDRVATPEEVYDDEGIAPHEDDLSVAELAELMRGVAIFRGHQFVEASPAHDIALTVKQLRALQRRGASQEDFERLLPGWAPSQGNGGDTSSVREVEGDDSPSARIVHGVDDRFVLNNTVYPHRVQIVFDNVGSTTTINGSQGSGSLIGPSTAMSVAHVFWDETNNTWEADHMWAPGFDSQDPDPSPWGDWYRCYWVTIPWGYVLYENHSYDYAVLDFDVGCNSVDNGVNSDHPGSTVGWLGFYTASASSIESRTGYVRGYPGVGTCGSPAQSCNVRVWGDYSSASENNATSTRIEHYADTSGGMSGSGFYHYADPSCSGCGYGPYLVGMHRAGASSYNLARRFTSSVYSFMQAYSSDY